MAEIGENSVVLAVNGILETIRESRKLTLPRQITDTAAMEGLSGISTAAQLAEFINNNDGIVPHASPGKDITPEDIAEMIRGDALKKIARGDVDLFRDFNPLGGADPDKIGRGEVDDPEEPPREIPQPKTPPAGEDSPEPPQQTQEAKTPDKPGEQVQQLTGRVDALEKLLKQAVGVINQLIDNERTRAAMDVPDDVTDSEDAADGGGYNREEMDNLLDRTDHIAEQLVLPNLVIEVPRLIDEGGALPDGGLTYQVLAKQSNDDGDADWDDVRAR